MKIKFLTILFFALIMSSCGGEKEKKETTEAPKKEEVKKIDPKEDKGIGPVKSLTLGDIDQTLVDTGAEVFKTKCTACHKMGKRFIGPDLTGVTSRRTPEWIMNMILNPDEMVQKNEAARQLLMEYSAPMANQSLTEDESRAILEYLRTVN